LICVLGSGSDPLLYFGYHDQSERSVSVCSPPRSTQTGMISQNIGACVLHNSYSTPTSTSILDKLLSGFSHCFDRARIQTSLLKNRQLNGSVLIRLGSKRFFPHSGLGIFAQVGMASSSLLRPADPLSLRLRQGSEIDEVRQFDLWQVIDSERPEFLIPAFTKDIVFT